MECDRNLKEDVIVHDQSIHYIWIHGNLISSCSSRTQTENSWVVLFFLHGETIDLLRYFPKCWEIVFRRTPWCAKLNPISSHEDIMARLWHDEAHCSMLISKISVLSAYLDFSTLVNVYAILNCVAPRFPIHPFIFCAIWRKFLNIFLKKNESRLTVYGKAV